MRSYLTEQQELHSAVLAGPDGWQVDSLGAVHAHLSLDPSFQLAAKVVRSATGQRALCFTTLAEEAQWREQRLHLVPLPESCSIPLPSSPADKDAPRIAWAPGSTHAALLLRLPPLETQGSQERTATLLVLRLEDGATKLLAMERTAAGPFAVQDVQLVFATAASGRPRLAAVSRLQGSCTCPQFALLKSVGVEFVHISCRRAVPGSAVWAPVAQQSVCASSACAPSCTCARFAAAA